MAATDNVRVTVNLKDVAYRLAEIEFQTKNKDNFGWLQLE